jgi:hypothetical protein
MLDNISIADAHTHLTGGQLAARGLHDILLYHMIISELFAAGCPTGSRLTQWPGAPSDEEAEHRLLEAIPFLPRIANTSCYWILKTILRDLYDWSEPITLGNWRRLDQQVRERQNDRAWQREILKRSNVWRLMTELSRRNITDDDIFDYSLEWAFFTRTQRGHYDNPLYELERTWGEPPGTPVAHGAETRREPARAIQSLADVRSAMDHFVRQLRAAPVLSLATHISTELHLTPQTDESMSDALGRRATAGPAEQDIYASYVNELLLTRLADLPRRVAFQFSYGAEPLPHETASIAPQDSVRSVGDMVARHPHVQFVCLVSSRHVNQSLATLSRELPNLTLAGYWWHNFFPTAIRQVMDERLDMLPAIRQIGFFSDAYTLEWAYGKALVVRLILAELLARRIEIGQYDMSQAEVVARGLLLDAAREVLGMDDQLGGMTRAVSPVSGSPLWTRSVGR